jgi:hypothetical protein
MKQNCYPSKATMLSEIHSLLAPPDAFEVAVLQRLCQLHGGQRFDITGNRLMRQSGRRP